MNYRHITPRPRDITLCEGILGILSYYGGGWRVLRGYVRGDIKTPRGAERYIIRNRTISDASLRATLSGLKRRGLVHSKDGQWSIAPAGRAYLRRQQQAKRARPFPTHSKRGDKNNTATATSARMIVAFDIPESCRDARRWLRIELALLGFTMLQQSVWIGPAPLPEPFISALHTMDILQYMKFFHAAETEVV